MFFVEGGRLIYEVPYLCLETCCENGLYTEGLTNRGAPIHRGDYNQRGPIHRGAYYKEGALQTEGLINRGTYKQRGSYTQRGL